MNTSFYTSQINKIATEVKKAVIGKDHIIIKALLAMLCKGHILIEDIPGVGRQHLHLHFQKRFRLNITECSSLPMFFRQM